jgi:hypothetical protein
MSFMTWQRAKDDNYPIMRGEAMHRPTLLEGVLVALLLSLSVSPLVVFVQLVIGSLLAWKIAVMTMAYTYMCYLLARSGRRSGRVTLGLLALAVLLASLLFNLRFPTILLLCVTLIWVMRSFAYSRSLVSAVLQGGVCVLGGGAALMVYGHSGSLALALWSFFLVQAAFVLIPAQCTRRSTAPSSTTLGGAPDDFGRAYHAAEQALERLTTTVAG